MSRRFLACLVVAGLGTLQPGAQAQAPAPQVHTIRLSLSNVHLIQAPAGRAVLIDAGGKDDIDALAAALHSHGVAWRDIGAVVVTHGHSDHAGLAAEIRRRSDAAIVLGRGDVAMAAAGHNDELKPTNFTARLLMRFAIDPVYEAFAADIVVDDKLDLARFGLSGRVRQVPGHTPGSLVVELADGRAFVGDMVLGGALGGTLWPTRAGEHYFHADRARNAGNIAELLRQRITRFYLGHGGPVSRESVVEAFGAPAAVPAATR